MLDKNDSKEIVNALVGEDCPSNWMDLVAKLRAEEKKAIYAEAMPRWLKRMADEYKLLMHPDDIDELRQNHWIANGEQLKVIWASVLAQLNGPDSKEKFALIKHYRRRKYGWEWWEDTYSRVKPAYAARKRLEKFLPIGVTAALAQESVWFHGQLTVQIRSALSMVPKASPLS